MFGSATPQAIYIGGSPVARVYLGDALVWPDPVSDDADGTADVAPANTSPPVIYAVPAATEPPANLTPPVIFNTSGEA